MEKENLSVKIDYVKPAALDLGPVTVAYGGGCNTGTSPTGGVDCTTGNSPASNCAAGYFAGSGACRAGTGAAT